MGADIGTQSVKAAVFHADGRCLGAASSPLGLKRGAEGEVEQHPDEFYAKTAASISVCLSRSGARPSDVAGVAVAGQMAGILGVGGDGRAITPYDSWLDTRCAAQVAEARERGRDNLIGLTGCPAMVAHAPKIMWWQETRPALSAGVAKWVVPNAFVAGRLCALPAAELFIDATHLHFSGVADAEHATWSQALTDALGIDVTRLPRVVAPTEVVGRLSRVAAADCGLIQGVPVAAGTGDTAACALGAGVVKAGQALDVAGTASVLAFSVEEFHPDRSGTLVTMRGAVPGQWFALSYLAGGDLLNWLTVALREASLDKLLSEAAAAPPAGPLFLPYIEGRTLPPAPEATGAWLRLRAAHGRGDLARAVLESVAFEYGRFLSRASELYPGTAPSEVRVVGGGAQAANWNLIKASVLRLPYLRLRQEDFSCWGSALVAAKAVGLVDDLAATALCTAQTYAPVAPDPVLSSIYSQAMCDYRALCEVLVPITERARL